MPPFSQVLKALRGARNLSQLDLALEAGVSVRHVSFLETGRAAPSAEMVVRLGNALGLSLASKNEMLVSAGFAPRYVRRSWDDRALLPFRRAVEHTLDRHAPYPAITIDRLWSVLRMNGPATKLFGGIGIREGHSLLELMVGGTLAEHVENWPQVAFHAAIRLRTESAAQGGVPELDSAASALAAGRRMDTGAGIVVPTILRTSTGRLTLFTTIAQFGTPEDLTLDDLRLELCFPGDDATGAALRALAAG